MVEPFVPLDLNRMSPAKPAPPETQGVPAIGGPSEAGPVVPLKVLPEAKAASATFTPMTVPSNAVHAHEGHGPPGSPQPTVTLQKEGDTVVGVRIECICGQVIDLTCVY